MRYSSRLADFLFGQRSARRAVLELLFSHPGVRIHLREIARRTGYSAPMVAKELQGLAQQDVLVEKLDSNTRTFQANMHSPLARDIARIAARPKSAGPGARKTSADTSADAAKRRPRSLREAAVWGGVLERRDAMIREFCDEFYKANDSTRGGMLQEEPPLVTGDERANAYYAAVAEHLALTYRLPVPEWALGHERFLRKPFFPAGLESLKATLLVESPPAFRRRMIFVGGDPLSRPSRGTARIARSP